MHANARQGGTRDRAARAFRSPAAIVAATIASVLASLHALAEPQLGPPGHAADVTVTTPDADVPSTVPDTQSHRRPLALVSWHLDSAGKAGAVSITPEPVQIWRHTFGAERRSRSQAHFDVAALQADVVLLQGVPLLSHVRLLFPAREWRVVVSRQILRPVAGQTGPLTGWGDAAARTPTTAIAVRYQRHVRITGEQQITEIAVPLAAASGPSETPAAVAVRLRVGGATVWVVSADLSPACSAAAGTSQCEPRTTLDRWLAARPHGDRIVVGGRHAVAEARQPVATPCPGESLAEIGHDDTAVTTPEPSLTRPLAVVFARAEERTGCIARLQIAVPPRPAATSPP